MVTIDRPKTRRRGLAARRRSVPGVRIATAAEGKALFDDEARDLLGISGEAFLRRWDAGEYNGVADEGDGRKVLRLVMLIPFARRTPG